MIKFDCEWIKNKPIPVSQLVEINKWRNKLHKLELIGANSKGVGFGNISIRSQGNEFIITGSATGHLRELDENHYVLVNKYNLLENSLTCKGPIKASSESLSHAVIYECSPKTNAVIHIHDIGMWEKYVDKLQTTNKEVPYGTSDMANEIKRLFRESDVNYEKILVMGGHKEGVVSFGETLEEAGNILLNKFHKI
ncbi:class II aldolase/adducin family protein [Candidatus Pacearchaeota archaeon]|nr:class II aldolase/adducin family protein [Candidatus Pacearchaeota archaeon]